MKRDLKTLIELVGGWKPVADHYGLTQPAVSNWKARGLPPSRWLSFARFAGTCRPIIDPPITAEELEAACARLAETRLVKGKAA